MAGKGFDNKITRFDRLARRVEWILPAENFDSGKRLRALLRVDVMTNTGKSRQVIDPQANGQAMFAG